MKQSLQQESNLRINTIIVGICFIVATLAGGIAAMIGNPILEEVDFISQMAAQEGLVRLEAFLIFVMSAGCAGVGLGLYPILEKYHKGIAIGTVGFRLLESITEVLTGLSVIYLLTLGQEAMNHPELDLNVFQTIGSVINTADSWLSNGVTLIFWCIAAYLYYGIFYRYRLVPRWLSGWGLIGITLTVITSCLIMLGIIPGFGQIQIIANGPIALQEMVFAVWLIVKGINSQGGSK